MATINKLKSNLIEIHYSLMQKETEIVPAPIGTKLYYSGAGWGKLWKIFFIFWDALFGKTFKINRLKRAIHTTEMLFKKHLEETSQFLESFEKNLAGLIEDQVKFSERKYKQSRYLIAEWNAATKSFLRAIQGDYKEKFQAMTKRFSLKGHVCDFLIPSPIQKKIQQYDRILNIEKHLDVPTPFSALKKISQKQKTSNEHEQQLKSWISRINSQKSTVPISKLHKGLQALVKHIKDKHCWNAYIEPPNLARLELELYKRNLTVFNVGDKKHLQWRKENIGVGRTLMVQKKTGGSIDTIARKIVLGNEIVSSGKVGSNNLVFTIQDDPSHVVVVGKNRAILEIKAYSATEITAGIRSATWQGVYQKGRFAIVEKLSPFANTQHPKGAWLSEKYLKSEELAFLRPLINTIQWHIQYDLAPIGLLSEQLGYDKHRVLKSTKPILVQGFQFIYFMQLIHQCSKENFYIFKYIMKETGMLKLPEVRYFSKILKETFSQDCLSPSDLAALQRFQITDPLTIEKAGLLRTSAENMIDIAIKRVSREYQVENIIEIADFMKNQLMTFYELDQTICFFWPNMKKRLIESSIKRFKLRSFH